MRKLTYACRWLLAAVALIFSSSHRHRTQVRISEIHYDNTGTDAGEADRGLGARRHGSHRLAGRALQRQRRRVYDTDTLTGVVPATCGARGVVVLNYPANGIQNGSPDGIALVDTPARWSNSCRTKACSPPSNGAGERHHLRRHRRQRERHRARWASLARNAAGTWSGPAAEHLRRLQRRRRTPPPAESRASRVAPASATRQRRRDARRSPPRRSTRRASRSPASPFTWTQQQPGRRDGERHRRRHGVAAGDTTITATAPNGVAGSAALHVTRPSRRRPSDVPLQRNPLRQRRRRRRRSDRDRRPRGRRPHRLCVVLYNGNGGAPLQHAGADRHAAGELRRRAASFVVTYPSNGIQNGSPDGIALVDAPGRWSNSSRTKARSPRPTVRPRA